MYQLLVVDDQPGICYLLRELFRDHGIAVTTAASGREAISRLKAGCPDLMLLDLNLPEGNGFFVLEQAHLLYPQLPVVLMTAYREAEFPESVLPKAGVLGILRKPFDIWEARRMVLDCFPRPLAQEA